MNVARRLLAGSVAAAVVVVPTAAFAAWNLGGTGAGAAKATALSAPVAGSATAASATSLTVSVTSAPASGPTPSSYRVDQTAPSAVSNVCGGITGSTGSCTYSGLTSGTSYSLAIFAKIGTSWVSSASLSVSGTPTANPSISFSFPAAAGSYGNQGSWQKSCPGQSDGVCGAASGGTGTLSSVTVNLKRTVGSTVTYWNGTAWQSASTTVTATGTTSWLVGLTYSQLRSGVIGTATYDVTATANAASTATATRTFTSS